MDDKRTVVSELCYGWLISRGNNNSKQTKLRNKYYIINGDGQMITFNNGRKEDFRYLRNTEDIKSFIVIERTYLPETNAKAEGNKGVPAMWNADEEITRKECEKMAISRRGKTTQAPQLTEDCKRPQTFKQPYQQQQSQQSSTRDLTPDEKPQPKRWIIRLYNHTSGEVTAGYVRIPRNGSHELKGFARISIGSTPFADFIDLREPENTEHPTHVNRFYRVRGIIDFCNSGTLFLAWCMTTKKDCALKRLHKPSFPQLTDFGKIREMRRLSKLRHVNIVPVLTYYQTPEYMYLTLEYTEAGNLHDRLYFRQGLDDLGLKCVLYQVFTATAYMHDNRIMHGAIKASNVLLMSQDRVPLAKLTNIQLEHFGLPSVLTSEFVEFAEYKAPEVLRKALGYRLQLNEMPTNLQDYWSLGVLAYECAARRKPFVCDPELRDHERRKLDIVKKICEANYTYQVEVNSDLQNLIGGLLKTDQHARLCPGQAIMNHPWFKDDVMKEEYRRLCEAYNKEVKDGS